MQELKAVLARMPTDGEVWIYADILGEWMRPLPFFDERAAVCGYYAVAGVRATSQGVVLMTGAEQAL